jgi:hypothetical protein
MATLQYLFGAVLVLGLLAVAGVTAWLQVVSLRGLDVFTEEGRHERGRAIRRLIGCGVMVLLAVMLAAALLFLEGPAQELIDQGRAEMDKPEHTPFKRLYGWFWAVFLLLLLVLLVIAAVDFWVVRRYGQAQMRRLQEDRRAMIESQSARLRQRRQESE